ncbi:TRAP transporter small permease [Shouchella clausii]|jgi:TRAP-type C4-dicarboxylate transport system permease small subunit|uniref:TRAP transporter permease DctQ n=1 Tax=Shouchella clausii TaxID=79880 RepID=A0A268S5S7_SHOCL|nr:TRAP transporter small permease [Shouchella clausii]SPU18920.1 C4-dicarboxylate transport system permease small protein [Niallia circulans]AST95365.1 TRAP transporter small permease protein [Shouchella clausii]MBU8595404.1 TRAP transporter small permease [Shouchella clausii]MCM3548801.1 TRAP transporter small permease [Shouchella clausii]MCR1286732.1 TRAP transporter small permease [Shouchella clausii]
MIEKINGGLGKIIIFLSSVMFGLMVLVAIWQVFSRYVLNAPSTFSEEFLRYSLIWVTMIGGAYAFHLKKHIAIEMLVNRFSDATQKRVRQLVQLFLIAFALLVMVYGGIQLVSLTMSQQTVSLGIPMGFVYLSLPISGLLITWFCLTELLTGKNGTNQGSDEPIDL